VGNATANGCAKFRWLLFYFLFIYVLFVLKHSLLWFSCSCPLWTKISFFCAQGFTFCITILFLFHICAVCIKTHTVWWYEFAVQWINSTQQEVKLFGPAFSSPAIWSVIFQVLHFQVLHFQSPLKKDLGIYTELITTTTRVAFWDPLSMSKYTKKQDDTSMCICLYRQQWLSNVFDLAVALTLIFRPSKSN